MKLAAPAFALACAAALLLAADRPAEACSCAPPPPPCQAYARATAVFIGTATSVTTAKDFVMTTKFTIEELFKGPFTKGTVSLIGGGMCSAMFTSGQKYFVYAYEADGDWHAGLCGRTRQLDRAAEDLAHARNLPQRAAGRADRHGPHLGRARAADAARRRDRHRAGHLLLDDDGRLRPLHAPGPARQARPRGRRSGHADAPGPAGRGGVRSDRVREREHLAALRRPDPRPGRRSHRPARGGVVLSTLDASPRRSDLYLSNASATTDANGEYEVHGVQAGKHLVAVNPPDHDGPDPSSPIPTTYYPGVASASAARQISLRRSGLVENINFALPKPLPDLHDLRRREAEGPSRASPSSGARVWLGSSSPVSQHAPHERRHRRARQLLVPARSAAPRSCSRSAHPAAARTTRRAAPSGTR